MNFTVIQQPRVGCRICEATFPPPQTALPVVPTIVAEVRRTGRNDYEDLMPPNRTLRCGLRLFAVDGIQQPSNSFVVAGDFQAPRLIPSVARPDERQLIFVIGELAVRECGTYFVELILNEYFGESYNREHHPVRRLASVTTAPFDVVDYADYPRNHDFATPLSRHLQMLGFPLHLPPLTLPEAAELEDQMPNGVEEH